MEIDIIIMRVLAGTNSYEDIVEFVKWLNANEAHQKEFEKIKSYWKANTLSKSDINVEDSFKKLQIKIEQSHKKVIRKKTFAFYYGIAASLFIAFILGFFMKTYVPKNEQKHFTYITEGSTSTFYMLDSTKVILNKNSELTYTNSYGCRERRVILIGEAYFEVRKNATCLFIVDMGGAAIQVLGTKFTVNNRKGSAYIGTILLEGSVRFVSKEQNVLMKPNQKLLFNRKSKDLEMIKINPSIDTAWKDGLFKYCSVSFAVLLYRLEKDYNVKIVINNKRLLNPSLKVSGSFEQKELFENVLDVIDQTIHIKWTKKNNTYYIN